MWTDDVLSLASVQHNVRLKEFEKHKYKGEYTIYNDQPFILLRKELKNPFKLWVGLHEFGHHLLHYPVNHHFSVGTTHRMDREANFFAAIALMPTYIVKSKTFGEILEEYNYPLLIIKIRKEIHEAYKI